MLNNFHLSNHADECAKILSYLGMYPDASATQIGSWCGMSNQKIRLLCNKMAEYGIIIIGERKAFYGKTTIYRRNF